MFPQDISCHLNQTFTRLLLISDSNCRISKNDQGRKDVSRPRSRSVFTSSNVGDEVPAKDLMKFEGPPSWPPYVPQPITVKNYFTEDFNVSTKL